MATKVLGKVAMIPKGIWVADTYNKYEYVYHTTLNASYVALKDGVTVEPNGNGDGINWNILCKGVGVTTDNNYSNTDKEKVDSFPAVSDIVLNSQKNIANGVAGINTEGKLSLDPYLGDKYLGVASAYGMIPTGSDQTTDLNSFFDTLSTNGVKYAYFDKLGEYLALSDLSSAYKVKLIGNATLAPVISVNKDNYFLRICDSHRQFNEKINDCNDLNKSFKQFNQALSENRTIKITIFGESVGANSNPSPSGYPDIIGVTPISVTGGTEFTGGGLTNGEGYFHKLINMFTNHFPNKTFNFYNRAIGGDMLTNWNATRSFGGISKSWIEHVRDTSPDLILFNFGGNGDYSTAAKYAYTIDQIMNYIETNFSSVPDVAFLTSLCPAYLAGNPWGTFDQQNMRQIMAESVRSTAKSRGFYIT